MTNDGGQPYTRFANAHVQERQTPGRAMVDAHTAEFLAEGLCAAYLLFFSRSSPRFSVAKSRECRAEHHFLCLLAAAGVLWWLPSLGGELWGSDYLPRPLALFCVILAISARMNIKGENVSFGANPHNIGRHEESE